MGEETKGLSLGRFKFINNEWPVSGARNGIEYVIPFAAGKKAVNFFVESADRVGTVN